MKITAQLDLIRWVACSGQKRRKEMNEVTGGETYPSDVVPYTQKRDDQARKKKISLVKILTKKLKEFFGTYLTARSVIATSSPLGEVN